MPTFFKKALFMNPSSSRPYPWRLFWLLFTAGILGALAISPLAWDMLGGVVSKMERPNIPLPVLILVGVVQNLALFALVVWLGLKLSRSLGLGAPLLESLVSRKPESNASLSRSL